MKFSLVIPCYNESRNLPLLLQRCKKVTEIDGSEVIIVDNGSTDDTSTQLAKLLPRYPGCRSIRIEENRGYGHGIAAGLDSAKGDVIGWTHADMQTDPYDAFIAFELKSASVEDVLVKGKRVGRPFSDKVFTVGMSVFETVLLRTKLWDINGQPNVFSRSFYQSLKNPPDDFSFDLFVYLMAKKSGLKVIRFPVVFGERAFGKSHWNINWLAKFNFIKRTVKFSFELKRRL